MTQKIKKGENKKERERGGKKNLFLHGGNACFKGNLLRKHLYKERLVKTQQEEIEE